MSVTARRLRAMFLAGLFGAVTIAGCASTSGPRSSRLRAADLDLTVNEIVAQLAASDFLAGRTSDSPPMRIVTRRVENRTSDVLTASERWTAVARVQAAQPLQALARERNIVFQIPPDQIQRLRSAGFDLPLTEENQPTHVLTATFHSATRSGAEASAFTNRRKEYYYLDYRIEDVDSRALVWTGSFEFAREAVGTVVNWSSLRP